MKKLKIYCKTSSTRAFSLLFPPVGSASSVLQTKQLTGVEHLPKIICSFLHFGQRSLTNFAVDSRILFFIVHLYCLNSIFLALNPPPAAACIFLQAAHWNLKSVFLDVFLPAILHLVIAGFEYFPWFPNPRCPRPLMRTFEPHDSG